MPSSGKGSRMPAESTDEAGASAAFSRRSTRRPATISAAFLIHDQADRDAIASQLMRYQDENGQGWADIIDLRGAEWCGRSVS